MTDSGEIEDMKKKMPLCNCQRCGNPETEAFMMLWDGSVYKGYCIDCVNELLESFKMVRLLKDREPDVFEQLRIEMMIDFLGSEEAWRD